MDIKEHIQYWLDSAENDLSVSKNLIKLGHYDWCLYLGHLVLEKALKAIWVLENQDNNPPRSHNLLSLSKKAKLNLDEETLIFLNLINTFQIEARYPEIKNEFYKPVNKEFAETNFKKIKELYKWLKSRTT